ncbi:hypothetical protein SAMN03159496_06051 [Rhizobium sp. NFR07]|jgi:hypothetical protein|uniref:hypothetical protein n=1 Tax=Rhizobium sp. NFR07 TaxID=1566262 RepID=UPI0008E1B378|nr:hypothetical protein [Rhizobium sp. NFR07]SFB62513.1 hypothetical protein SAMN03159496_06051 [Rhizobium sp. NFR07]
MPDPFPMLALAVFLIAALGIFAFFILRRGKLRRRPSIDSDPATATQDWLKREAENAKKQNARRRYREGQPSTF